MNSKFQYVEPSDEQINTMQEYRNHYEKLYFHILDLPRTRGRSIAITKLEESAYWINKAITLNDGSD